MPNAVINPLGSGLAQRLLRAFAAWDSADNPLSFEPGVPIYVDDVYLGRPQGAILDLLDLDRVEVLHGPQGTLFGKNAVGVYYNGKLTLGHDVLGFEQGNLALPRMWGLSLSRSF